MTARLAERTASLVCFGAWAAIAAGVLRIASTFIPYEANSATLEALYAVIDVGLTFGLIAIYIATAEATGLAGLAAFIVALAGLASIVGPDAAMFGVDFYRVGALVFVTGLAGLSVQLLRAGVMRASAGLWVLTLASALASSLAPQAFMVSGFALGAGFALAGFSLMRKAERSATVAAA